jgi:hypothetical protein
MNHLLSQRLGKRALTEKRVDNVLWRKGFVKCARVFFGGNMSEWRPVEYDDFIAHGGGLSCRVQFRYISRGEL